MGERIIAYTEQDLQEKAARHICGCIIRHQKSSSSKFLLGLSPTNGLARRSRAREVYSAIAEWTEQEIDWSRVRIILLDERYGFEQEEDCNATLVRESLVKTLQKRGITLSEEQFVAPNTAKGWQESASEYQERLVKLLQAEGVKGFSLVSTGLGAKCQQGDKSSQPEDARRLAKEKAKSSMARSSCAAMLRTWCGSSFALQEAVLPAGPVWDRWRRSVLISVCVFKSTRSQAWDSRKTAHAGRSGKEIAVGYTF
ncbi:unnamed protein product [Durusdinium trenchii]|uniref:Glucosamine/galactosamine-6-phosphate isomerase domain-containing protein n=1 Tax=Durusdinium trenchii TaxID=1381693 RepID=A0ABP0L596_9DINO